MSFVTEIFVTEFSFIVTVIGLRHTSQGFKLSRDYYFIIA